MTLNRFGAHYDGLLGIVLVTPDWGDDGQDLPVKRSIGYYNALRLRDELNQAIKEYEDKQKRVEK